MIKIIADLVQSRYTRSFKLLEELLILNSFPEPPGAPGEPSIVDFDNKSVTLRWAKPKDTGGRPISHYIIQKKDKFGGWFDALITDDLVKGKRFKFGQF